MLESGGVSRVSWSKQSKYKVECLSLVGVLLNVKIVIYEEGMNVGERGIKIIIIRIKKE